MENNLNVNEILEKGSLLKQAYEGDTTKFEELRIRELISRENSPFQSIGVGIHNDVFYFGFKLFNEDNKPLDAVITSDGKIYVNWGKNNNKIKKDFGLNYRFPFYHEVLDYFWSMKGKYGLESFYCKKIKKISLKKAYERILNLQRWKVWHPDERVHKHHALKILSTYFLPCFEMKGRELIYGDSGFGKTRQTKIYQLLAFNPSMSVDWSDASVFRVIESTKATILIDNFDSIEGDRRRRILHLFNTGCYSRQKAVRTEARGKSFTPIGFDVYSNMVLNSITPLGEIEESRSHITRCLKTDDPSYARLEENNPIWQETRDMLYVCALQNWKKVKRKYDKLKASDILFSREFERVADTLTIAKLISEKLYNEMLDYYKEEAEKRKVKDLKEDWLYVALEHVIDNLKNRDKIEISVKEIAESKGPELFDPNVKDYKRNLHSFKIFVGKSLKTIPLFKSKIKDGYTIYEFNKDSLIKFCKLKGFEDLLSKIKTNITDYIESENSTNSEQKEVVECV
ncbi:MAG: hypothetical protein QXI58_08100 [Candidatus Micrarchaeia archaeon]